jgi:hypothetical protein
VRTTTATIMPARIGAGHSNLPEMAPFTVEFADVLVRTGAR